MTFALTPIRGERVWINGWNWRPTLELLLRNNILPADQIENMGYNWQETPVSAADAVRIAEFLDEYLAEIQPGQRVNLDGVVISEPDTFEFHREDMKKNYSATHDWLVRFRNFCRSSGGFVVG